MRDALPFGVLITLILAMLVQSFYAYKHVLALMKEIGKHSEAVLARVRRERSLAKFAKGPEMNDIEDVRNKKAVYLKHYRIIEKIVIALVAWIFLMIFLF